MLSENIEFVTADAFHHLADLAAKGEIFDVIVLDPPKFAPRPPGPCRRHSRAIAAYTGWPSKLLAADGAYSSPAAVRVSSPLRTWKM